MVNTTVNKLKFIALFLISISALANTPEKVNYETRAEDDFINNPSFQNFHICFNVGCLNQVVTGLEKSEEEVIRGLFAEKIESAARERVVISKAIGIFEYYVSRQSSINTWTDKKENTGWNEIDFLHDCIDKSNNVTSFLLILQEEGLLRFHKVKPVSLRESYFFDTHFAATIQEVASNKKYIVDSWFLDNGYPATVLPLEEWEDKREEKYSNKVLKSTSPEYKEAITLPSTQFDFKGF